LQNIHTSRDFEITIFELTTLYSQRNNKNSHVAIKR